MRDYDPTDDSNYSPITFTRRAQPQPRPAATPAPAGAPLRHYTGRRLTPPPAPAPAAKKTRRYVRIEVDRVRDDIVREKAFLVIFTGNGKNAEAMWLPKSQVERIALNVFRVPLWLATEKGMV